MDAWARELDVTAAESDAIRAFQSRDRHYALINGLLRGTWVGDVPAELLRQAAAWLEALDRLTARARTPCDVLAYRGLRDLESLTPEVGATTSTLWRDAGFMSTSLRRRIAMDEFTRPSGVAPALLRIFVPSGTAAIWMSAAGLISEKYQMELLLARGTALKIQGSSVEESIVVVDCEVAQ